MPYRCLNPECKKIFPLPARISVERRDMSFNPSVGRIIVEKPCCLFCESIVFEELKSPLQG